MNQDSSNRQRQQIKDRVQKWLIEEGFQVRGEEAPNADFQLAVTSPRGLNIVVLQPLGRQDQIVIAGAVNLSDIEQRIIAGLPNPEREDFLWDLRFTLLENNFDFTIEPPNAEVMRRIIINDSLWQDGLTKDSFMKTLSKVSRGIVLLLWKNRRKFGGPLPEEEPKYVG